MPDIIVKTQEEIDVLPARFEVYTRIIIQNDPAQGRIIVRVAWDNSSVVARGNSSVVARDNSGVHLQSDVSSVMLFAFAACWKLSKGKVTRKSKTATVITPKRKPGASGWLEAEGVSAARGKVTLYKRVSSAFKTQENSPNETTWKPGTSLTHENYDAKSQECGPGKFHACSTTYFCDEFRSTVGDRYIAISVATKDMHAWKNAEYPHKIAFKTCKVLYECDKKGKKI